MKQKRQRLDRRTRRDASQSRTEYTYTPTTHAHTTRHPPTPQYSSTTMMLHSLARGTLLRRSLVATSALAAPSTMTRAMGMVTYSPPAVKIGKPAPDFTAVRVGGSGGFEVVWLLFTFFITSAALLGMMEARGMFAFFLLMAYVGMVLAHLLYPLFCSLFISPLFLPACVSCACVGK